MSFSKSVTAYVGERWCDCRLVSTVEKSRVGCTEVQGLPVSCPRSVERRSYRCTNNNTADSSMCSLYLRNIHVISRHCLVHHFQALDSVTVFIPKKRSFL